MPFDVPPLNDVRESLANDYELKYQQAGIDVDAHTRGTGHTEKVNAIAAVAYSLRLNQEYILQQQFVDTMDEQNLVRIGTELEIDRIAPSFADGFMTCTGNVGTLIPANTPVQHAAGMQYRTTADRIISGATDVPITALQTGVNSNLTAGDSLSFVTPIAGVNSDSVVGVNGVSGGTDIEDLERYRARVKARRRQPPQGGNRADYEGWARAASSAVFYVWVSPHEQEIGETIVRIVLEDIDAPLPSAGLLQTVTDYIELRRPVQARFQVLAPTLRPLNLNFTALSPNTPAMQAAIIEELKEFLKSSRFEDTTLPVNKVRSVISNTPGIVDFELTLNANIDVPISDYVVLGTTVFP